MERLGLLLGPTISISQGANRPNQRAFRSDGGLISRPGMQLSELAYLVANPEPREILGGDVDRVGKAVESRDCAYKLLERGGS